LKYIPYEGPDEVLIFDTVIVEATTRNEVKRRKTENTLILLIELILKYG
jgi:hypothetical protein